MLCVHFRESACCACIPRTIPLRNCPFTLQSHQFIAQRTRMTSHAILTIQSTRPRTTVDSTPRHRSLHSRLPSLYLTSVHHAIKPHSDIRTINPRTGLPTPHQQRLAFATYPNNPQSRLALTALLSPAFL